MLNLAHPQVIFRSVTVDQKRGEKSVTRGNETHTPATRTSLNHQLKYSARMQSSVVISKTTHFNCVVFVINTRLRSMSQRDYLAFMLN